MAANSVMTYNVRIEIFPVNFIASMFSFGRRDLFEVKPEAEREAPQVKF